ncbi:MAG: SRPBCC family protein [Acidimicrobiales bacterium]
MTEERHATSRRIDASPARIFALLTDPATHAAIDGSGMVEAAIDARPITAVGDTFDMDMDRTPIGDIPGLVKYKVRNHVTRFEQDRLIEWTTGGIDLPPVDHLYGWVLEAVGDGQTEVTHYCDWSGISDEARVRSSWPIVPLPMLETSIDNLERLATDSTS